MRELGIGEGHVTLTDEAGLIVAVAVLMRKSARSAPMAVFVFDIETIPDVELGRRVYGLHDLSDKQVGYVMQAKRREESGSEFLSFEQQRVVAISVAMRTRDRFQVWSLGEPDAPESELIQRFFDGIEKFTPDLVSWNGSGFDLPVLHYRALRHGIVGAALLGSGRRRPGIPLQQLSEPLPRRATST